MDLLCSSGKGMWQWDPWHAIIESIYKYAEKIRKQEKTHTEETLKSIPPPVAQWHSNQRSNNTKTQTSFYIESDM